MEDIKRWRIEKNTDRIGEIEINKYTENTLLQIGENHGDYTITGISKRENDTRNYYKNEMPSLWKREI